MRRLGYLNEVITTTTFRRCYFHYCRYGVTADYIINFEDCVFEANDFGVNTSSFLKGAFHRCWWEANLQYDVNLNSCDITISDSYINSYTRQTFFIPNGGINRLTLSGNEFITSDANPLLFFASNNVCSPSGSVLINSCNFPANLRIGGSGNQTRQGYDKIVVSDMRLAIYRFKATGVSGAITSNPMPTEGGLTSYTMPTDGHMLGLNIYASAAVSAGSIDVATKLNGNPVTNFSYPFPFGFSSFPASWKMWPYENRFNAGDNLEIYFHTLGISPTVDFTYEVIVALGPDGL